MRCDCNNTCLPQTHNKVILSTPYKCPCPCSAINTVPGEDGHRARTGRFETSYKALGPLGYQCTKSPDVVKRTAELLAEVGHEEGVKHLKGQRVYMRIVCLLFIMLLAHVHD